MLPRCTKNQDDNCINALQIIAAPPPHDKNEIKKRAYAIIQATENNEMLKHIHAKALLLLQTCLDHALPIITKNNVWRENYYKPIPIIETTCDIACLQPLSWLQGNIIDDWLDRLIKLKKEDIMRDAINLGSTFYQKLQNTNQGPESVLNTVTRIGPGKKLQKPLWEYELVIFPVNLSNAHWALITIDFVDQKFKYYDSLFTNNDYYFIEFIKHIWQVFKLMNLPKNPNAFKYELIGDCPQQLNSSDCGIFTMKFAEALIFNCDVYCVDPTQTEYYRQRICYELSHDQFLFI